MHDVTHQILLLIVMHSWLKQLTLTSFMEDKKRKSMECLDGMKDVRKDGIILEKNTYGLVQAVRQYHKMMLQILKKNNSPGVMLTHASM